MYRIFPSTRFIKEAEKISRKNSKFKSQLAKTLKFLKRDISYPSLRLHKLSGINYWSVSVDKSIRIIMRWNEDKLYLLRIGTHEEVY